MLSTLSPDQMVWLSGYLAGLRGRACGNSRPASSAAASAGKPAEAAVQRDVTVLFGSQTGNSEHLAGELKKRLEEKGFAVTLSCMSEFRTNNLEGQATPDRG